MTEESCQRNTTMGENDDKQPLRESEAQAPKEAHDTQHKMCKPSVVKFKRQSVADLSRWEWIFIIMSILDVVYATVLSGKTLAEQKSTSAQFTFTIVVFIATAFLLVYSVHGVFWKVPYSILLHCMLHFLLVAGFTVDLVKSEDKEPIIIVFLALGIINGVLEPWFGVFFLRKYVKARTMRFPYGTDTYKQDEIVRHLLAMCLLLLNLHLELTLVVFVLKVDKTGLEILEYFKLVGGCIFSLIMCVCGFLFLYKKWKPLVFIIPFASLIEVAYIIYNLINTGQTWQAFPDDVIPASIIAVSIACLAVRSAVCVFLGDIHAYKQFRTEVDDETSKLLQRKPGHYSVSRLAESDDANPENVILE